MTGYRVRWCRGVVSVAALVLWGWACMSSVVPAEKPVSPRVAVPRPAAGRSAQPVCAKLRVSEHLWVGFFCTMELEWVKVAAERAVSIQRWLDGRCEPDGQHRFDALRRARGELRLTRIDFCDGEMNRLRVALDVLNDVEGDPDVLAFWMDREQQGWRIGPVTASPSAAYDQASSPEPLPPSCGGGGDPE